ncbi:uncharacterized protein [Anabrus simplex]|uniref:uncharacterized protein isoform X2 n=1 Tax=Anabrus simplex TaxID=316456 RepID=UPI0035A32AD3
MEEVHFVKCEIDRTSDTEESSKFEEDVQLPCTNPLDIKVEPYLKSDDQEDDEKISDSINEELIIQDLKEELNDDDDDDDDDLDSGTFANEYSRVSLNLS